MHMVTNYFTESEVSIFLWRFSKLFFKINLKIALKALVQLLSCLCLKTFFLQFIYFYFWKGRLGPTVRLVVNVPSDAGLSHGNSLSKNGGKTAYILLTPGPV